MAVITAIFFSCSTPQKTASSADLEGMQHVTLDTMTIMRAKTVLADSLYPFRPARAIQWDLIHTVLDLSFDWSKQNVMGVATLTMTPLFYAQSSISLDAIDFEVQEVRVNDKNTEAFERTPDQIIIRLPRAYEKGEKITVSITYTAHPQPGSLANGQAIYSDQGLFFIDPLDTLPDKPLQLWSQGETSSSRRWFPTLDQPNQRGTQELWLTVPDSMMTLSNGLLVSSTPLEKGMRRDYWKLDLPHAPYLTMIAVGKWDKVTDYWRGRPVEYYVDPGYGKDARAIFANTPEMIEFFSKKLDYTFVWPKYSQVIVKDFVTGAMENTTAVTFGDFIQFHAEDMLTDGANDYIVSHELFHHWFGDLVTCESWANITLNEGFANYAEYLWAEYKYGREKADVSRMAELSGYYDQTARETHPLFYGHYADEQAIFDAHSYNKGGLVLHMLRDLVGDKAFFESLHFYLLKHQFSAVEICDLRQAFEEVTGQDLQWFFDQWFFEPGHPVLSVEQSYDPSQNELTVHFTQTQEDKGFPDVFRLPVALTILTKDTLKIDERVWLDRKDQSFTFKIPDPPLAVVVDPRDILLAVVDQHVDPSEYPVRGLFAPSISHRLSALRLMTYMDDAFLRRLSGDSSMMVRAMAIQYYADHGRAQELYEMGQAEKDIELQYYILESLQAQDPERAKMAAMRFLQKADRVPMIYAALKAVAAVDPDEAMKQLAPFESSPASAIYALRASLYAQKGTGLTLDFFTTPEAAHIQENYLEELISAMARYLSGQAAEIQDQGLAVITSDFYLRTPNAAYRRFYLITGLLQQYNEEAEGAYKGKLIQTIKKLYQQESDDYLKGLLKEGLGSLLD